MKVLFAITIFLSPILGISQQIINMEESDVDLKVQTWHYTRYEKSKDVAWILKVKDGEGVFEADFTYQGDRIVAAYTDDGLILWEKMYISEKNIPAEVTELLDYRIVKYKIDSFTKYSEFDEVRKMISSEYQVIAKTKTGGEVVYWFDSDLELIPEKKYSELARR